MRTLLVKKPMLVVKSMIFFFLFGISLSALSSDAIVSGSVERDPESVSEATKSVAIRSVSVGDKSVTLSEAVPFDSRRFALEVSAGSLSVLDCTPPPTLMIFVK